MNVEKWLHSATKSIRFETMTTIDGMRCVQQATWCVECLFVAIADTYDIVRYECEHDSGRFLLHRRFFVYEKIKRRGNSNRYR